MKKILFFMFMLTSCYWAPTNDETKAVEKVCKPLCFQLGRKSYKVGAETNGFGCVFNYTCECYPAEGRAVPITIQIDKNQVQY
jgi:hypothetical protein